MSIAVSLAPRPAERAYDARVTVQLVGGTVWDQSLPGQPLTEIIRAVHDQLQLFADATVRLGEYTFAPALRDLVRDDLDAALEPLG